MTESAIAAIMTAGLRAPLEKVPITPQDCDELTAWARTNLMIELATAAFDQQFVAPSGCLPDLADEVAVRQSRKQVLEDRLREGIATISAAGIPHRCFKGVATKALLYPNGERDFSDVDFVVPADRFADAMRVLEADGWRTSYDYARPRLAARIAPSQNLAKRTVSIDLHRSVVRQPFDERVAGAPFASLGVQLDGFVSLSPEELTLCAALDLIFGGRAPKPWAIRDCLQGLTVCDTDDIREAAERWNVRPVVAVGLDAAAHLAGLTELIPGWVDDTDISATDARLIRLLKNGPSWLFHFSVAKEMTGAKRKLDYLRTFTPTRAQLRRSRPLDLARRELVPRRWR